MTKRRILYSALGVIVVVAGVFFFDRSRTNSSEIVLGVILPLSGELAPFGEKIRNGVELALGEFDRNKFKVIYEDTRGAGGKEAVSAYQKLRSIDKANIIIGPFGPEQTLALAPLADKDKVPVLAVSLCDERFLPHASVFCTYPAIDTGVFTASPYLEKLGIDSIALFTMNGEIGLVLEDALKEVAADHGAVIVGVEKVSPFSSSERDFRTTLVKLMQKNPEAIYIGSTPEEGHVALKQLYELGYKGYRFAQLDSSEEKLDEYGVAMEGVYFPGYISPNYNSKFSSDYEKKFGTAPDLYAALGHSSTHYLLDKLASDNWQSEDISAELVSKTDLETAIPGFTFTKDRQVSIPQVVFRYFQGEFNELPR